MISWDRSTIDHSYLQPSPRAAGSLGMRVYHRILVLRLLDNDFNPIHWGRERKGENFEPIMTDIAEGQQDILKVIRFSCKHKCRK